MTLNSTVRMPPRTRKVSPLRTGRYAGMHSQQLEHIPKKYNNWYRTLEEIRLEVNFEYIAAETLDRVVEGKYVYALAVLDIEALMDIDKVTELHTQVVAGDFVHLDSPFFYIIRAQANQNGIAPLFTAMIQVSKMSNNTKQ